MVFKFCSSIFIKSEVAGAGGDLLDAVGNIGAPDGIILLDRGSGKTKAKATTAQSTPTSNVEQRVRSASASNTLQTPAQHAAVKRSQSAESSAHMQSIRRRNSGVDELATDLSGMTLRDGRMPSYEEDPLSSLCTPVSTAVPVYEDCFGNTVVGPEPVLLVETDGGSIIPVELNEFPDVFPAHNVHELPRQRFCDPSMVEVSGPGVEDGILSTYQSAFLVEMDGAGRGRLQVSIRGPKGILLPYLVSCAQNCGGPH